VCLCCDFDCSPVELLNTKRTAKYLLLHLCFLTARASLVISPPENVDDLFSAYHSTLSTLLDKHVPLRRQRLSTRHYEQWYDGEYRASKRLTRRLERINRRCHTVFAYCLDAAVPGSATTVSSHVQGILDLDHY